MRAGWAHTVLTALGLVALGFVCGTAAGMLILLGLNLSAGAITPLRYLPGMLALNAFIGGPIGALVAPIAWFPLRRVPLRRVIFTTAVGTVLGGVAAAHLVHLLVGGDGAGFAIIPGSLLGFGTAAIWLWWRTARHYVPAESSA